MSGFVVSLNSKKIDITVNDENKIVLNGENVEVQLSRINNFSYLLKLGDRVYDITAYKTTGNKYAFSIDGHYYEAHVRTALEEKANELMQLKGKQTHGDSVKAPMPGLILDIKKEVGDDVEIGESLCVLEAMKMENDIRSPATGKITEIFVSKGESIEKDGIIMSIE